MPESSSTVSTCDHQLNVSFLHNPAKLQRRISGFNHDGTLRPLNSAALNSAVALVARSFSARVSRSMTTSGLTITYGTGVKMLATKTRDLYLRATVETSGRAARRTCGQLYKNPFEFDFREDGLYDSLCVHNLDLPSSITTSSSSLCSNKNCCLRHGKALLLGGRLPCLLRKTKFNFNQQGFLKCDVLLHELGQLLAHAEDFW